MEKWDFFIHHVEADQHEIADPLCQMLTQLGFRVLTQSRYEKDECDGGVDAEHYIVILSKAFFARKWSRSDLISLFLLSESTARNIIPIWYAVDFSTVKRYSRFIASNFPEATDETLISLSINAMYQSLDKLIAAIRESIRPKEVRKNGIKNFIAFAAQYLVDGPRQVKVHETSSENRHIFRVIVGRGELQKLLSREKDITTQIQTIFEVLPLLGQRRATLEIVETSSPA